MSSSQAQINATITARDSASKVIGNVNRSLGGLSSKASIAGTAIGTALGGLAVQGIQKFVGFIQESVGAASNMNETMSKTQAIFGDATTDVLSFAETAAGSLGLSKQAALDASSTFAVFGKSAGLSQKELSGFSGDLVSLSADFASFYNTSPEQAITAIGAALRGENEPIRKYNVLLNDATLRQEAMKMGLIKTTTQALTPQQKVLAAHAAIMKNSTVAQGDFARTSGGLANQQRILAAKVANVSASFGTAFLPVMTEMIGFVTTVVLPAFESFLIPTIVTLQDVMTKLVGNIKGLVIPIWESMQPAVQGIAVAIGDFAAGLKRFIDNSLNPFIFQVGKALKGAFSVAIGIIGAFIELMSGPFGKVMLVLGAMVLGGVIAWKTWTLAVEAHKKAVLLWAAAQKLAQAPTIIMTTLQGALNAVMAMNPIMLVVIAIAALVAGFIAAYTFIKPFHDAVDALFGVLVGVGKFLVEVFIGTIKLLGTVIGAVGEMIMNSPFGLFLKLIIEVAKGIGGIVSAIFGGGQAPTPGGMSPDYNRITPRLPQAATPTGYVGMNYQPPVTNVSVTLDGKEVAQNIDTRLGRTPYSGSRYGSGGGT